ncbi:cardiolipin synthase [Fredinandcohnia sp. QZ13]|uniref:cardiolipin synthase n=1 Tax=Fredinandcohnia sp. QZ13 TaxID=3073144 RepID=UPI0028536E10|nr:cardiolipin synthase [Fredinandcohnia sp. QZ13]MDR4890255.1 cardiolipin synthase [Fredinandcohnia sp. QZ13]
MLRTIFWIVLIIIILLLLLRLDYSLGRKSHLKKQVDDEYPLRNSEVALYATGESLFSVLFSDIQNATEHIHVQFYILKNDDISKEFVSLLKKKAEQGVKVRLLLDWVGAHEVTKEMEKGLTRSGVSFAYSNKPNFPYYLYKLNERNHRKITVIDGKMGYIGGFNIGKEYLGKDPKFGFWRDYHLRMTGEGVADLQTQFLEDWYHSTREAVANRETYFPPLPKGPSQTRLIATNGAYLEDDYVNMIKQAEREIIIGSPYFVPSDQIKKELINAVKRNVKVRILLPKKPDHPLVKEASVPYLDELSKLGIQFNMYTRGFYHAKVICIDDKLCDIGTANFDKRSLYSNYEINCYIHDKNVIKEIKKVVEDDFATSNELTRDRINELKAEKKFKIKIATWISHFL